VLTEKQGVFSFFTIFFAVFIRSLAILDFSTLAK